MVVLGCCNRLAPFERGANIFKTKNFFFDLKEVQMDYYVLSHLHFCKPEYKMKFSF